ncbi:MAG: hypothetical protein AB3X44_11120 [Leptothrix sp. (in: b-proteobacteria)]
MTATALTLQNNQMGYEEHRFMSPAKPPLLTLVLVILLSLSFQWCPMPSSEAAVTLGGTLASVGATMLGFMLAALAVLTSINHTHLIGMMRRTGHYQDLLITIFVGCCIFLVCTVAGYFLAFGLQPRAWFVTTVIGMHTAALVSLVDIGRKFWLILCNLRATDDA